MIREYKEKVWRQLDYIIHMRPLLNKEAMFSDTTKEYVSPQNPTPFTVTAIRFRAGRNNVDAVYLVHMDQKHLMFKESTDDFFDYYAVHIMVEERPFEYYFEIHSDRIVSYYGFSGPVKEMDMHYCFRILPGFSVPEWTKGAVMYQIFVDRFYNGDPSNDVLTNEYRYIGNPVVHEDNWSAYPDSMDVRRFYGGDLQGVIDKMDYLEDLGVEVLYLNPIFVSPSNHKYDTQDYDYVDPHIGKIVHDEGELLPEGQGENYQATRYIDRVTNRANLEASNDLFAELVKEAHRRGMRVILDGVFNHCGSFNKWLDRERIYENASGYEKGAYVAADSPYRRYFHFHKNDSSNWPYNGTYDGWWAHDTLPKLNYEASRELFDYILKIGKKWVSEPYNVDGWRLDVAADLGHSRSFNHHFWNKFRKAVKEANPEALILAEHYGSAHEWLQGQEWDTVMNYDAFMEPVSWFLTGMQKHSDEYRQDLYGNADSFWGAMNYFGADFSAASLQSSMNELSNHDHSRFLTRTNSQVGRTATRGPLAAEQGIDKAVFREGVVIQMTWPGAPTIYYGDEAGLCGFTDPDNRRTYPWGKEDQDLIRFHKEMIRIHKEHPELKTGSIKNLGQDYNFLSYGRFSGKERTIVLINNNNEKIIKKIPVWQVGANSGGILNRILLTDKYGFTTEEKYYRIRSGYVTVELPPTSAVILKQWKEKKKNFLQFH